MIKVSAPVILELRSQFVILLSGENMKVRRMDGTGRLWEDVFADARILFMPPNVCALLVLFCRNHNVRCRSALAFDADA